MNAVLHPGGLVGGISPPNIIISPPITVKMDIFPCSFSVFFLDPLAGKGASLLRLLSLGGGSRLDSASSP
jgi:hypothetical protein